ncbi:hypothetical protein ACP4OV_020859 [Aristida adscensionis]
MANAQLSSPEQTRSPLGCIQSCRRRRRLLIVVQIISAVLAAGIVSATIYAVGRSRRTPAGERPSAGRAPTKAIARTCGVTLYPALCISELAAFPCAAAAGDVELVPMWLNATRRRVVDALSDATALAGARAAVAYHDCVELLDAAGELLDRSVRAITTPPPPPPPPPPRNSTDDTDTGAAAVVYRCAVLGYQDTLYAHAQRQFYRDCDIAGTVDVVFGNAAAVLQNCTLWARRPLPEQKNTVTAQGRTDPNQSTGISAHGCRLLPAPELAPARRAVATYLGRPWKPYSRTVYMVSFMADHVHAAGWLAWDASGRVPDTLYYGEYRNDGPGAAVGGRVAWPGHRVITSPEEAMEFTAGRFIDGCSWLPPTGVAFVTGMNL